MMARAFHSLVLSVLTLISIYRKQIHHHACLPHWQGINTKDVRIPLSGLMICDTFQRMVVSYLIPQVFPGFVVNDFADM
jgi:hypothetical protein